MAARNWGKYIDRVEEKQGVSDCVDSVFQEAEDNGFDPVILRLLVREKKMSQALDDFLARRLAN
ncbi:MAG: DUF2312 domain-containing protein [Magnetococcales bacterium]|nr:DUF2312 domain-containing protein [Magnetococcales bacterium]